MPLRTLSLYAQRVGKVFASATTWAKLVRQRGWRRPRRRVYPEKPKTGIRATYSNEYWHIDVTVIRLVDDTKAYLHAVIDNFSRRILSWRLSERLDPSTTCEILKEAGKNLGLTPTVIADSGVENVNAGVDQLMADGVVRRVLALVEVSFSNSMIEAFWVLYATSGCTSIHSKASRSSSSSSISTSKSTTPRCPTTPLTDRHPTRCTSIKSIVSGTASRPASVRPVGGEWRPTDVSCVACADHLPLNNPWVLLTRSQMRRRDSRMFPDAAGLVFQLGRRYAYRVVRKGR